MTDIIQNIVNILKNDVTLASLMNTTIPIKNLYVGTADIVKESQTSLAFPMLIVHAISETYRTVPLNAKDSTIQIDIVSRNSEKEVHDIYEKVSTLLNFQTTTKNNTWIAWQRGSGLNAQYSSEARLWQFSFDIQVWSV